MNGDTMLGPSSWESALALALAAGSRLLKDGRLCGGAAGITGGLRMESLRGRGELGLEDVLREDWRPIVSPSRFVRLEEFGEAERSLGLRVPEEEEAAAAARGLRKRPSYGWGN